MQSIRKRYLKIRFFVRKVNCPYNKHWDGICYDTFPEWKWNGKLRKCEPETCGLNCFDGKIE